jgi:PAS domain S-box-containing protein
MATTEAKKIYEMIKRQRRLNQVRGPKAKMIGDSDVGYSCAEIINSIPLIVWISDIKGKVISFNKTWYDYTGTSEKRTPNYTRIVHEADFRKALNFMKARNPSSVQIRLRAADGRFRWFLIETTKLSENNGNGGNGKKQDKNKPEKKGNNRTLWLGTARDIHVQKEAEEGLIAAKASLEVDQAQDDALMESLGEAVIATDMDERIIFANKSAEEMLGYRQKEMIGLMFSDVFDIYDKLGTAVSPREFLIPAVLRSGKKVTATNYYFTTAHKKKFPAAVTSSPIVMDGHTVGSVSIFRNTKREAQIDKAKTEFVSLASHQLRTPLTAVKLFTEMLLADQFGKRDPEQRDMLESIERANEKMIRLVDNLLDVANMEAGRMWAEPVLLTPSEFINSVIKESEPLAHSRGVEIVYRATARDSNEIDTDPYLLRQILSNILTNAIQYSKKNTKVVIRTDWQEGKELVISVEDHGIGIAKRAQREVFNRFFRAENAIKFKTESSGLGLYVCKMMVEVLGGKITFKTEIQKGTTFYVHLPLKEGKSILKRHAAFKDA